MKTFREWVASLNESLVYSLQGLHKLTSKPNHHHSDVYAALKELESSISSRVRMGHIEPDFLTPVWDALNNNPAQVGQVVAGLMQKAQQIDDQEDDFYGTAFGGGDDE